MPSEDDDHDSAPNPASGRYSRALLKISGEAFGQPGKKGLDIEAIDEIAEEIARAVQQTGTQMVIVVGGGNILRGDALAGAVISRAAADYMGMLGTIINGAALLDVLESKGVSGRLMSSLPCDPVAEPFIRRRAETHLDKGHVVILTGGLGKPLFTTDTCAAQAALELRCEILLKGTQVDGVYSDDPKTVPDATRFEHLSYEDVLAQHEHIKVMDMTAISLCMDHALPIIVFGLRRPGNILAAVQGKTIGTRVTTANHGASG